MLINKLCKMFGNEIGLLSKKLIEAFNVVRGDISDLQVKCINLQTNCGKFYEDENKNVTVLRNLISSLKEYNQIIILKEVGRIGGHH